MKINHALTLLTLGLASISLTGIAQTTSPQSTMSTTETMTSETQKSNKSTREQRPAIRNNRSNMNSTNQNAKNGTSPATPQEGQYRQSSSAAGTSVNNSNSTNYNSNNVTDAPTGVGSNPSVTTNPTTLSGSSSGNNSSSAGSTSTESNATGAAVTGARATETPAEVAGSTERTTSIHDFIASSPNYVTLQNALQATDLYETLKGSESYTLFAPSNAAFKKLPAAAQSGLLEGRNQDALKQLLSYHLVKGSLNAAKLKEQIKSGNGKAQLQTLGGGTLTAQMGANGRMTITDEQGKKAMIDDSEKMQTNGLVYGIDAVLMPKNATFR